MKGKKDKKKDKYRYEDYFYCRFCDWKCLKWYTNKNGKRCSGQKRMSNHVEFTHWLEHDIEMERFIYA